MKQFETRSAITLLLALGVAFGANPLLAAEGDSTAPQKAGAVADEQSQQTTWDLGGSNSSSSSGGLFGSSIDNTGIGSRSATANYQLGGAGVGYTGNSTDGNILTAPTRGRAFRFDNGIFVYPSVSLGYGYNDNVLGTQTNKRSSTIFVLRPELVAELKTRGDRYTLSYQGNYGRYQDSSADNFDYHELWMAGDNYFTSRARLGWGVGYIERSDPRGSNDTASGSEPNRWHAPVVRLNGIYGAQGAIGRFELSASHMAKRYDNNRASTIASDVDLTTVSGSFYYRFMPRTSALVELRNTWANYVLSTSTQDNTDTRIYAGVVWEATAKTTGTLRVGRAYKNFDSSARQDGNAASWEGSLRWSPLTYSTFDLALSRSPSDSTGQGDFTINNATTLTWNHKWASYISSRVSAGVIKTDYKGAGTNREDSTKNYGIGFFHEIGYRARVGIDWNHTDRSSNNSIYDFKRNTTMLTLDLVL